MSAEKERIAFIVNPISGTKNKQNIINHINNLLDFNKFIPEFHYTERAGHATELAQKLASENCKYVVAIGGDGTVNEVGRGLVHTETALGIIPSGSGNGLARHLKVPMNTKKAIEFINNSRVIDVDYGKANDNIFFCTCGTGFDAHISQQFALAGKRGIKTYVEKIILEYFSYKTQPYHLKNENIDINQDAFLITFANASQYGNNAYIAPHADMQDGLMDISILSKFPLLSAPTLAVLLFSKKIDKSHYITILQTNKITLEREKAGAFHFDGESHSDDEKIEISIINKGLKVLVRN